MARLPLVPTDGASPELGSIFDDVRARIDHLPALYQVIGHSPDLLRAWIDFAWPLRLKATTPRALRELMILRGARITGVDYEWAHHVPMALAAGVTRERIDALADWEGSPLFDERERAALRMVDEVTRGPGASGEAMEALRRHFTDAECVELLLTAAFYVCVGRFLTSVGLEIEPDHEIHRPRRS